MTRIAFLRAINILGKNMIKMSSLTAMLEKMGFSDIKTYLQSGNVIFKENSNGNDIENRIEIEIKKRLALDIKVIVRTKKEVENIITNNPFIKRDCKIEYLHVTLLRNSLSNQSIEKADEKKAKNEEYFTYKDNVYLYCPNGYGRTKLNTNNIEIWSKQIGTTRNWKTITAIGELLK